MSMTVELRSVYEVLRSVRGRPVQPGRTIRNKKDKARASERRDWKQRGRREW